MKTLTMVFCLIFGNVAFAQTPCPDVECNVKPVVDIVYSVTGDDFRTANFDASGSKDEDGEIVSYSWDFGDGTDVVTGANVSHTYAANGVYIVGLTVTDNCEGAETVNKRISIGDAYYYEVPADSGVTTAISVETGDLVIFSVHGQWCWAGCAREDDLMEVSGPTGSRLALASELPVTSSGSNLGMLIGTISRARYFEIGNGLSMTAKNDGIIELKMNDRMDHYAENTGAVVVKVEVVRKASSVIAVITSAPLVIHPGKTYTLDASDSYSTRGEEITMYHWRLGMGENGYGSLYWFGKDPISDHILWYFLPGDTALLTLALCTRSSCSSASREITIVPYLTSEITSIACNRGEIAYSVLMETADQSGTWTFGAKTQLEFFSENYQSWVPVPIDSENNWLPIYTNRENHFTISGLTGDATLYRLNVTVYLPGHDSRKAPVKTIVCN